MEKPLHMVLIPMSPTSHSFARVPLTHGLQLPRTKLMQYNFVTYIITWALGYHPGKAKQGKFFKIMVSVDHLETHVKALDMHKCNPWMGSKAKLSRGRMQWTSWPALEEIHQGCKSYIKSLELQLYKYFKFKKSQLANMTLSEISGSQIPHL